MGLLPQSGKRLFAARKAGYESIRHIQDLETTNTVSLPIFMCFFLWFFGNAFGENVMFLLTAYFAKPIIMQIGSDIVSDIGRYYELFLKTKYIDPASKRTNGAFIPSTVPKEFLREKGRSAMLNIFSTNPHR